MSSEPTVMPEVSNGVAMKPLLVSAGSSLSQRAGRYCPATSRAEGMCAVEPERLHPQPGEGGDGCLLLEVLPEDEPYVGKAVDHVAQRVGGVAGVECRIGEARLLPVCNGPRRAGDE